MDILQVIALGLVQAITEWLPLSSKTMDTILYKDIFGGSPESVISVLLFLHLGTLAAAALYFRKEIIALANEFLSAPANVGRHSNGRIGFLASALVSTGVVGGPILLIERYALPALDGSTLLSLMGAGLVLTGFLLTSQHRHKWRNAGSVGWKDGVLTGALQGLSALPGVSRAGTSTTALIWRGFDSESAFHLSFLLSIPTVFAMEVVLWIAQGVTSAIPFADGLMLAAASFFFGYLTIKVLIRAAHRLDVAYLAFIFGILMLLFGLWGLG